MHNHCLRKHSATQSCPTFVVSCIQENIYLPTNTPWHPTYVMRVIVMSTNFNTYTKTQRTTNIHHTVQVMTYNISPKRFWKNVFLNNFCNKYLNICWPQHQCLTDDLIFHAWAFLLRHSRVQSLRESCPIVVKGTLESSCLTGCTSSTQRSTTRTNTSGYFLQISFV